VRWNLSKKHEEIFNDDEEEVLLRSFKFFFKHRFFGCKKKSEEFSIKRIEEKK
jgi:hypothetical protein